MKGTRENLGGRGADDAIKHRVGSKKIPLTIEQEAATGRFGEEPAGKVRRKGQTSLRWDRGRSVGRIFGESVSIFHHPPLFKKILEEEPVEGAPPVKRRD
jgi:hypothetical protein